MDTMYGSVPSNVNGYQYAHTGNAYVGIYTYVSIHNGRDYIQDSLTATLITNTRYYVTFYVSLADSEKYACNSMGAYFSDTALSFPNREVLPYTPQVANNEAQNPLTDKVHWTKVAGSFVAQGGEQYIIIGNFKDDAHSDTVFVNGPPTVTYPGGWKNAYYYIDDVIVSPDSAYADSLFSGVNEVKRQEKVSVFPNPANTNLHIQLQNAAAGNYQINLFNSLGEEVLRKTLQSTTNIATTTLPQGLYYYRISGKGKLVKAGKIAVVH